MFQVREQDRNRVGEMRTPLTGLHPILHINIADGNHFFANRNRANGTLG
jgi:hypothetical protein